MNICIVGIVILRLDTNKLDLLEASSHWLCSKLDVLVGL